MLLATPTRCIFHVGSANYSRRSLTATVLESNVRIDAPIDAKVSRQVLDYAEWMASDPRSLAYENGHRPPSWVRYWLYRFLAAPGCGTC
jgi:phosphatidylserine/phosphatidylglycerophosphate/cardiolipin synthase-like enzyme